MRTRLILTLIIFLSALVSVNYEASSLEASTQPSQLSSIKATSLEGKEISLKEFEGKVMLIVNTASKCGFTPQYKDLQELYANYEGKGLVVLGFPSNDFGEMEPGTNEEIRKFCKLNFGVQFPMFARSSVSGETKNPVYKYLTSEASGENAGEVEWNFEKFLVDRHGKVRARFGSQVNPLSKRVTDKVDELLKES